jgi:hypothetical protein
VEHGRPWSFDGDGHLFRLVSEAHRIRLAHLGVVSPNPRKFRHPTPAPATIASRLMSCPSPREGVTQDDVLVQERAETGHGNIRRGLIAPEILEPICRQFGVAGGMLNVAVPR